MPDFYNAGPLYFFKNITLQSCRLRREYTTICQGEQEQDATIGRRRGGQAGGCEAEVPQEATRQPVGAKEMQIGGGVAGLT
jgi:hypothetical protein